MKIKLTLGAIGLLSLSACNFGFDSDRQSIAVKRNETKYQFTAEFPHRKTASVTNFVNKSLHQDHFFANPDDQKDLQVNLGDSLKFHIEAQPGFIEIKFRKIDNSPLAYEKLERMCMGIKEVLR